MEPSCQPDRSDRRPWSRAATSECHSNSTITAYNSNCILLLSRK